VKNLLGNYCGQEKARSAADKCRFGLAYMGAWTSNERVDESEMTGDNEDDKTRRTTQKTKKDTKTKRRTKQQEISEKRTKRAAKNARQAKDKQKKKKGPHLK
jgi:hypothetical protein